MSKTRRDMQVLYDVEYGVRRELVMRLVGTCFAAVMMHIYADWKLPFAWCLCYLLSHALHWRFLIRHKDAPRPGHLVLAGLLYLLVVLAFMWLPTFLAMQEDPIMIYVGSVLMTSTMVYQIRRADRILWLNWAQIGIFAMCATLVMLSHLDLFNGLLAKVGAVLVTIAAFVYVALAMLYSRASRIELEETAARMAQDQKMSAIGRLAGGIAHDFNNMLTVVKGNLELYHMMEDRAERDAAVLEAQMAAERAEEVVRQLLIYARKAPTRVRVVNANEAVASTMTLVRSMVPERVEKEFEPYASRLAIEVDAGQLAAALLNLVKNAVDAMQGAGRLTVTTGIEVLAEAETLQGQVLKPGRYTTISVADTGSGIPPEALSRVAEPFFTTKPPGQGTGLGLSMVAGFVQGAGGGLRIVSSTDGTTVTLLFPALDAARPALKTENAAPEGGVLIGQ